MATLPDVAGSSRSPSPRPAMAVVGYDPGRPDQTGAAVSAAGREVQQASDIVAATNERQDALVAQSAANALQRATVQAEFDPETGFRNAKEGQALGKPFLDTYTQRLNDSQKQIREGLLNDNQRRMFDQHAAVVSTRFQSALLEHQAVQTERFNDTTDNATLETALQGMAIRPDDELGFQTGLVQIGGTIDRMAQRKGLPPVAAQQLKSKMLDAAYSTRITATLQGVPGVQAADPYRAEAMFRQVQDRLSPQSQVTLARTVQKAVQDVQARDSAQAIVFGRAPVAPNVVAQGVTGPALAAIVEQMESGGNKNAVSPKGAMGAMQVMPNTAANPGFGVRPAQLGPDGKPVPGELERVGRDYLGAMSARYDNPALVLAAYNAGPGQVDKWLAQYGDPRAGQISTEAWAAKIPFNETRDYVANGLRKIAAAGGNADAPVQAPTAKQLKTDLYARVSFAREIAEQQYPGDPAYADAVAARVLQYGNTVIQNAVAVEQGARDGLLQGMLGTKADGSDGPQSIDELLADPQMRRNWDNATPEVKQGIQHHFANQDKKWSPETFRTYYQLLGESTNEPATFANRDLGTAFGSMPLPGLQHLTNLQASLRTKESRDAQKAANYLHADAVVEQQLRPLKLGKGAKTQDTKDATNVFYGQLHEALDAHVKTTGKPPTDSDISKIAASLLVQGQVPGGLFGSFWPSTKPAFMVTDMKNFMVPLPTDKATRDKLMNDFKAATGRAPKDLQELQEAYTRYKLAGGK